jgi:hypothetical protein
MKLTPEQQKQLHNASAMFTMMTSFCKNNPAVATPSTHDEYKEMADALHQILVNSYKN